MLTSETKNDEQFYCTFSRQQNYVLSLSFLLISNWKFVVLKRGNRKFLRKSARQLKPQKQVHRARTIRTEKNIFGTSFRRKFSPRIRPKASESFFCFVREMFNFLFFTKKMKIRKYFCEFFACVFSICCCRIFMSFVYLFFPLFLSHSLVSFDYSEKRNPLVSTYFCTGFPLYPSP